MILCFVRHGQTEWSVSGQHTGRTDIRLTRWGEAEAAGLRPVLASMPFDHVLTSPATRARRTCDLAGLGAQASVDPDLAEWDYGEYEGRRSIDICRERPGWTIYRDGCPGGEMPEDLRARADRLIARLAALRGRIGLFSHGQFGCCLAARWIGLDIGEAQHFQLGTASVSLLATDPARAGAHVIAGWNWQARAPAEGDARVGP